MEIKVTSQYLNKEQMVVFEQFVDYCVRRFHLKKHNVRIRVSVCQKVENGDEGNCRFDTSKDYAKEIKIKIRYCKNVNAMLTVLSHEMVHAKQYITGQLMFIEDKAHWRGENVEDLKYREQPHEIEAFELESVVLVDFYKARKKKVKQNQ